MDNAELVVDVHQGDKRGCVALVEQIGKTLVQHAAVGPKRGHDNLSAELVEGVQHTVVLNRRTDHAADTQIADSALQRHIVGLRATTREKDLSKAGVHVPRHHLARRFDYRPAAPALSVDRRRIAVLLAHQLGHVLDDLGMHRRRRRVVEVNAAHQNRGF